MYDIDFERFKSGHYSGKLFIGAAAAFFFLFSIFLFQGAFIKLFTNASVEAYDVKIEESEKYDSEEGEYYYVYQPTYYFEVDGHKYERTRPYYSSDNVTQIKNEMTIFYNKDKPYICVSEYESDVGLFPVLMIFLFGVIISIGCLEIKISNKKLNKAKWLAKNGTLIEKLPYKVVFSGLTCNDVPIDTMSVEYKVPGFGILTFNGDYIYDNNEFSKHDTVDLLIDLNDPTNYYVDFEINKKNEDKFHLIKRRFV